MHMTLGKLLWVDDEIEMLRPHILFLNKKNYDVATATNGADAVDLCRAEDFDLILLDENMPGLSGLETLALIKEVRPGVPVVMVTKSEEEDIMDQAIGSKIADYLIKPVNPNQILLTLKKNIHRQEIVTEATVSGYRQEFARLGMQMSEPLTATEWMELYKRLVYWELELSETDDGAMRDMLRMQKEEANHMFARFVKANYAGWIAHPDTRPLISPDVFRRKVFPLLDAGRKVFVLVLDNFRLDQWRLLSRELNEDFAIDEELYYSILPTATQYARNALFSGLMPEQIRKMYPHLWVEEEEDEEDSETLLLQRLKEYELFKQTGARLREIEDINKLYRAPGKETEKVKIVLKDMVLDKLLDAFALLLAKQEARGKEKEAPKKIIKDRFTVAEKILSIRGYAREHKRFPFEDLFTADMTKSEMINVFLALLELLKLQSIRVEQLGIFEQINIISNEVIE